MKASYRNGIIAKIHIARKDLALDEDCYRSILARITGKDSTKTMSFGQLESVMAEFKRLGWTAKKPRKAGHRKQSRKPQAKMIRALWLELRDLNELRDSSEDALAAFARNTTDVEDLEWLTSVDADKVIKALRGWIDRVKKRL